MSNKNAIIQANTSPSSNLSPKRSNRRKQKNKRYSLLLVDSKEIGSLCKEKGMYVSFLNFNSEISIAEQIKNLQKDATYIVVFCDKDRQSHLLEIQKKYNLPSFELAEPYENIIDFLNRTNAEELKSQINKTISNWRRENKSTSWEFDGCYWKNEVINKEIVRVKISNFTFENEALIVGEEISYRIVSLVSNGVKSPFFIVDTDTFSSVSEFCKFIERKGNYSFKGTKNDLYAIKELVFKHCDKVEEVPQIGYHKGKDSFVFSNSLINGNNILYPNDLGIVNGLYIPSAAKANRFHSHYQTARKYRFENDSELSLSSWLQLLGEVYSSLSAHVCIAFIIACLYFDIVSQHLQYFPMFNFWGKKGTGKNTFASSLLALFTKDAEKISLQTATYTGMLRKLEQTANIPQWFEEYNNRLPDFKIETLKNIYDLTGKIMGAKTQDSTTKQSKILSPCIVSGQEAPTINEALLSRFIIVPLQSSKHTDNQRSKIRLLKSEEAKGLGNILIELLQFRDEVNKLFKKAYYDCIDLTNRYLEVQKKAVNTRLVNNYASLLAVIHITIDNGLILHQGVSKESSKNQFNEYLLENLIKQAEYEQDNQETYIFWEIVAAMMNNHIIKQDIDYAMVENEFLIGIRPQVFHQYAQYYYKTHKRVGVDVKTLKEYLKSEDYYKKEGRASFLGISSKTKQQRCMFFDYKKLEEIGIEF